MFLKKFLTNFILGKAILKIGVFRPHYRAAVSIIDNMKDEMAWPVLK